MGVVYQVTPYLHVLLKEILEGKRNFLLAITWKNVCSVISASPHKRRGHRSRSRSPYRRRSRSRSRSRSPHRRRHRSKSRSKSPEKSSKKSKKSERPDKKKESESTGMSKDELEVKEANELRAKLNWFEAVKTLRNHFFLVTSVGFLIQYLPVRCLSLNFIHTC